MAINNWRALVQAMKPHKKHNVTEMLTLTGQTWVVTLALIRAAGDHIDGYGGVYQLTAKGVEVWKEAQEKQELKTE